jgi:hypothetical protein
MMRHLVKFENDDLVKLKQFRAILNEAIFEVKGNATLGVASLFVWYDKLESKIDGALKQQALDSIPKTEKLSVDPVEPAKKASKKRNK